MTNDLLTGLNEKQMEAVRYTDGPLLILAGAGSGKTRVLTHRIGYILEQGLAQPWQILAITFTNKAAGEMRERVDRLLPGCGQDVFVSTFHSMCVRMLRRDIDRLGYDRDFSIYDTDDQKTMIRQVLKDLKMDPKQYRDRGVLSSISAKKNAMISAEDFESTASDFYERNLSKIYKEYEQRLQKNNALDFDDLLLKTVELFDEFPEVLESWQNRFIYCMVDEYQDTNAVQFKIVSMLSAKNRNICVVGDDDQSIYKFRGADITNILSFENSFPGAKVVKLEQNYRSTKRILHAANEVIKNNRGRKDKTLWTDNEEGEMPVFTEYDTAGEEADRIIKAVKTSLFPLRDQAVLYRTNAQSRLLEEKCIALSIPYVIVGGVNFYQRKEIKDILSYLRIIANGVDDLACERILNVPKRGIGDTTVEKVKLYAQTREMSMYDALCTAEEIPDLNKGTVSKISGFTDLIEGFRKKLAEEKTGLKGLIESVRDDTGYAEELKKDDPTVAETRIENIEELISKAVGFEEELEKKFSEENADSADSGVRTENRLSILAQFLEDVSLVSDIDRTSDTDDVLTMMTLHGAKGLEFEKVYLCGMEEGLFPGFASMMAEDSDSEVEEERRLCYVGMTRAKKELAMSSAAERMTNGETHRARPSRFVDELPEDGVEIHRKKRSSGYDSHDSGYDSECNGSFRRNWTADDNGFRESSEFRAFGRDASEGFGSTSFARSNYGGYGGGFGSLQYERESNFKKPQTHIANDAFKKAGSFEKEKPDCSEGDRVTHLKFGDGTVKSVEEDTKDYKVTVEFDDFGTKIMYAKFAKLEKI